MHPTRSVLSSSRPGGGAASQTRPASHDARWPGRV